jgi:cytosine/adenosine deaminase-related metal-dependent hydrolase
MYENIHKLFNRHIQMRTNSRNCAGLTAQKLLETATKNGAKSLGIDKNVGEFSVGKYLVISFFKFSIIKFVLKDFIAIDLNSPRLNQFITDLDGSSKLLDAIIFSAGNAEILMSFVAGQMRFGRRGALQ